MSAERGAGRPVARLPAHDGTPLQIRDWPLTRPRAVVVLVHGLGEHAGRYGALAGRLNDARMAVVAADLRGHGLSGGQRGHAAAFEDLLADLDVVVAWAAASTPGRPLFLLGHSLGGLVVLRYLQARSSVAKGAVLSAPALAADAPGWAAPAARALSPLLPRIPFHNLIRPKDLSHDPEEVEAYRRDPLVHHRITPRLFAEMRRAMRLAAAEGTKLTAPLLFLLAGDDRVVRSDATLAFASSLPGDVQVRVLENQFHDLFHEADPGPATDATLRWLEARIP